MTVRLLLLAFVLIAAPAVADDPPYDEIDEKVLVAPGISLDASLYVPKAEAPAGGFPLLVRHHGGGSHKGNDYDKPYGLVGVERGDYALLMYSVRGHGGSGGVFDFFGIQSVEDFRRMLDWAEQRGGERVNTEKVGVSGYSQGGGMSLLPAAFDPRVKAVAVGNTFASLNHALNPNGCYKLSWATGIFTAAYKASGSRTDDVTAVTWGLALTTDTEDVGAPVGRSANEQMLEHSPLNYVGELIRRQVPVFWAQSWEDQLFPGDHPEMILSQLDAAGVPVHYWFSSGGHAAGPDFLPDQQAKEAAILAWFDVHLRGVGTVPANEVDYAERIPESDGWIHRTAAAWPVSEATPRVFHPQLDGTLASAPDANPTGEVGAVVNDLANVNVRNDDILNEIANNVPPGLGMAFQSVPETGTPADTRAYASAELTDPLEFVGAPAIDLDMTSTSARQFQVSARLYDLAPDGSATMVGRSCISLPGGTTSATLPLWPNAHVFAPGHRIHLAISAVDFPTFEPDKEPQTTILHAGTTLTLPEMP